jgi:hypothetical protein
MTGTAKRKKSGKAAAIEICAEAVRRPAGDGLQGRTPAATLSAALYTEAKRQDDAVVRVGRGMIKARPQPNASGLLVALLTPPFPSCLGAGMLLQTCGALCLADRLPRPSTACSPDGADGQGTSGQLA